MIYLFIGAILIITAKSQSCTSHDDCIDPSTPFCYGDLNTCLPCFEEGNNTACTDNPLFGPGSRCEEFYNGLFTAVYCAPPNCTSQSDCAGSAFYPFCNELTGKCAQCVNDTNCMDDARYGDGYTCQDTGTDIGYYCTNETMTTSTPLEPACSSNANCTNPYQPYCDNTTLQCVTCRSDEDCVNHAFYGIGTVCSDAFGFEFCVGGPCSTSADCGNVYPICGDNSNTCGACNDATDCDEGQICEYNLFFGNVCINNGTETTTTIMPETTEETEGCSIDADCSDDAFAPICNNSTSECIVCRNDTDCVNNAIFGDNTVCQDFGHGFLFKFCFGGPCVSDTDCGGYWYPVCGADSDTCVQCNDADDCMEHFGIFGNCESNSCVDSDASTPTTTEETEGCSIDDDCSDAFSPICDNSTSECITCRNDTDCVNNVIFGDNTVCQDFGHGFLFKFCFGGPCVSDTDCGSSWYPVCGTDSDTCVQCNDADDCMGNLGISGNCESNFCVAHDASTPTTTSPYTTTFAPESCIEVGSECDADDGEGICTEFSIGGVTVKYCVPTYVKLCDDGDDCLTGQTCIDGPEGISFCTASDYDSVCTVDPNDCDDGLTCYDASNNANKDNFCYLSCTVETQDDDCDIDGYTCQLSEVNDVELLTCVYDASTVADPTPEPTAQPTAAPEDPNTSGVKQLAMFGGMIIMIVNSLYM